uniref:Uncharacterized protein n=1 Tax=Siphoviridae sp. ctHip2 TaxID=2827830 RepID=A0A8S5RV83_9CAUD|nr:MAG TPA: hypothetical protein [Siphoviridae sp. ctHip2]
MLKNNLGLLLSYSVLPGSGIFISSKARNLQNIKLPVRLGISKITY